MEIKNYRPDLDERTVVLGFESQTGFVESQVALNAVMQQARDMVVESKSKDVVAASKSLWEEEIVDLKKKLGDNRISTGACQVVMNSTELKTLHGALHHYSARTTDETKFAMGVQSLEPTYTRIIEGAIAGSMAAQISDELGNNSAKDATESPKPRYGFARILDSQ